MGDNLRTKQLAFWILYVGEKFPTYKICILAKFVCKYLQKNVEGYRSRITPS